MFDLANMTYGNLDLGGIISLIATVAIILYFRLYGHIKKSISDLKESRPFLSVIVFALAGIGLTGLWLTIRLIALFFVRYISVVKVNDTFVGYYYQPTDIFLMLSYILTANLCFTLLETFAILGEHKKKNGDKSLEIRELVNVAIQAVIIAFITFIPSYRDSSFSVYELTIRYVVIGLTMIISLTVLLFARNRLLHTGAKHKTNMYA